MFLISRLATPLDELAPYQIYGACIAGRIDRSQRFENRLGRSIASKTKMRLLAHVLGSV
jgi:hypothetical protein